MYHKFLQNTTFHEILNQIDRELAKAMRARRCIFCAGPLHIANYPRSPLGLDAPCREHNELRYSFCCGICRKRVTTPSVRFFGRNRFPAAIIMLISFFKQGVNKKTIKRVQRYFEVTVHYRTWRRWHKWWQELFTATKFWKQAKGLINIRYLDGNYPRSLLLAYSGSLSEKFKHILKFLAPLTAGFYRAV